MSHENGLQKIECFTLSSIPPPLPSPPPPLSFTLSRSVSLDQTLSLARDRQAERQTGIQTYRQTDRQVGRQVDRPTDRQTDRPGRTLLCPLPPPNPLLPLSRISNIGTPSPSPTTLLFQKVVGQVAGTRIKIDPPPRVSFSACCFSNMSTMKVANIMGLPTCSKPPPPPCTRATGTSREIETGK